MVMDYQFYRSPSWHFSPNAIWYWHATKDRNFTAQVCRIGDGAGNESYQYTVFQGTKELKKDCEATLAEAKKTVFGILNEDQ